MELWGTGAASREFLYVEDAARGIVLAAERYDGEEPVNLGVGHEMSIRELAGATAGGDGVPGGFRWYLRSRTGSRAGTRHHTRP